jgi:hypothetical protein
MTPTFRRVDRFAVGVTSMEGSHALPCYPVACAPPLPEGREINAHAAGSLVLESWGYGIKAPRVFIVEDDGCAGPRTPGSCRPTPARAARAASPCASQTATMSPASTWCAPFDGRLSWRRCFVTSASSTSWPTTWASTTRFPAPGRTTRRPASRSTQAAPCCGYTPSWTRLRSRHEGVPVRRRSRI